LSIVPAVDAVRDVAEVTVEDVTSPEPKAWGSAMNVCPQVIVERDSKMAGVFLAILVRVPNQRPLEVIVEMGIRYGYIVASMCDIQQTVVVILSVCLVTAKIAMIDPDAG
jgi:hypothetical protein